jgi:hypothetical protein
MITNCEHCSREVEDDNVQMCELCGLDGLCPDCTPPEFHECEEDHDNRED